MFSTQSADNAERQHYRYKAPLFKDERCTFERIEKFISNEYFVDCNLRGRLYGSSIPVQIKHLDFGHRTVSFNEAVEELTKKGESVDKDFTFGPTWSTHWFQVDTDIPKKWHKKDLLLRFDTGCEALAWNLNGTPIQGISPSVNRIAIHIDATPSLQRFFVEASANDRNGDGDTGQIRPAKLDKQFQIKLADVVEYDKLVDELLIDFELLLEMANYLPKEGSRRYEALYQANDMINRLIQCKFSVESKKECHQRALQFFKEANGASQLTLHAIGNCHIDTAWLWRFDETKRKCTRSWSTALSLMERNDKITFAVSQAQQLVWIRKHYPTIYEDMQDRAADGRLMGVGGSWVEMDANMPSGESLIRQMLYGQRELKRIFGKYSTVFWLPDTFGYSAQLPQLIKHCGMNYFVTQKMSWSLINKFPHHSFRWFGIDGTDVLVHFPPHHYVAQITVKECLESLWNFTDRGRSKIAMMLYGHGDGGGGPDESMLKRADRLVDCDGVPKVKHSTPDEFFTELEKDVDNLCEWRGELYLELHNATYTTQSNIKRLNRILESILRDHEFVQAMIRLEGGHARSLSNEWKDLLLNQFHDVLPGTCIKEVIEDALNIYDQLLEKLTFDGGNGLKCFDEESTGEPVTKYVVNSCGWNRVYYHNSRLLELSPFSITAINKLKSLTIKIDKPHPIASQEGECFILRNRYLTAKLSKNGHLMSVKVFGKEVTRESDEEGFEIISSGSSANRFVIFDDVPLYWDAWDVMDYHLETAKYIDEALSSEIVENTPIIARLKFTIALSDTSKLSQFVTLRTDMPYLCFETAVDWNESHKFLKVEFPLSINSDSASYDIQYGHVSRPTHRNTSWDAAKYEVCAHKWMSLCEYNRGAALLNNCKYGHSCDGNIMRISLLRSSKSPDENADIGRHQFSYAFYPFMGSIQQPNGNAAMSVMRCAFEFNNPVRYLEGSAGTISEHIDNVFKISGSDGVIIDTIKASEDDENALIMRLFECFGGSARIWLHWNHARIVSIDLADGLEQSISNIPIESTIPNESEQEDVPSESVKLEFHAFELKTLLIRLFAM